MYPCIHKESTIVVCLHVSVYFIPSVHEKRLMFKTKLVIMRELNGKVFLVYPQLRVMGRVTWSDRSVE